MDTTCPENSHKTDISENTLELLYCEKGEWLVKDVIECSADNIDRIIIWTIPLQCTENGWQEAELECTEQNEGATRTIPSVGYEVCRSGEWIPETKPKEFQSRKYR